MTTDIHKHDPEDNRWCDGFCAPDECVCGTEEIALMLLRDLMYTVSTSHLDMSGNHKYALSHRSNPVITQIKEFLNKLEEAE